MKKRQLFKPKFRRDDEFLIVTGKERETFIPTHIKKLDEKSESAESRGIILIVYYQDINILINVHIEADSLRSPPPSSKHGSFVNLNPEEEEKDLLLKHMQFNNDPQRNNTPIEVVTCSTYSDNGESNINKKPGGISEANFSTNQNKFSEAYRGENEGMSNQ